MSDYITAFLEESDRIRLFGFPKDKASLRTTNRQSLLNVSRLKPKPSHHRWRGGERRRKGSSGRRSSLTGRETAIVSQTNTGTLSKAPLGEPLRDRVQRIWPFPTTDIDNILD